MASPERIARAADARSPVRSTMLRLGDAATCSTKAREVSERSVVDDDHAEPADHRMAEHRGQHHEGEQRHAEDQDQRHAVVQQPAPFAPGDQQESGLRRPPHRRAPPVEIGAHAGPQLRHLVDRIGADREGAQVEIAGGAGGAPARIFALGGDQLDLDGDAAVAERRNAHVEAVADFQRLDQILAQIEMDPHVAEIDQRDQRHARRQRIRRARRCACRPARRPARRSPSDR